MSKPTCGVKRYHPPQSNDFVLSRWIRFKAKGKDGVTLPHRGLLSSDLKHVFVFRECIHSHRDGEKVVVADVVDAMEKNGEMRFTNLQVVVKVFCDQSRAAREAYTNKLASDGKNPSSNVVKLQDLITDEIRSYIVLEFLTGGDLFLRISTQYEKGIPEHLAKVWFSQILRGMHQLKENGLAHMDLSPENILLDENDVCKVIDFGMSCAVPHHMTEPIPYRGITGGGKRPYMSPEVHRCEPVYPYATDIWSLAILLYVMVTGAPLYMDCGDPAFQALEQGEFEYVVECYGKMGCVVPEGQVKDLLRAMLNPDPLKRPTVEEIFKHPWLAKQEMPIVHHAPSCTSRSP